MVVEQQKSGFPLEKWMTIPAVKWVEAQGLLVKWEFGTPWGICDIVAVELAHGRLADRIAMGQRKPIGPAFRVALFQLVPDVSTGRSTTVAALSAESGMPLSTVEANVQVLIERRFLKQGSNGTLQSLGSWVPLHNRIIAIELKLDKVEAAIAQARAHAVFATESFIGLPQERAARLVRSGRAYEIAEEGVGLLAVSPDGASLLTVPTRSPKSDPILQMHFVERFLQANHHELLRDPFRSPRAAFLYR